MERFKDSTTIHFLVAKSNGVHVLHVKETPDEIHMTKTLRSFSPS
jgi:hypothetical protein